MQTGAGLLDHQYGGKSPVGGLVMSLEFKCTSCQKDLEVFLVGTEAITECPFCKAPLNPTSVKWARGLARGLNILILSLLAGGIVFVLSIYFAGAELAAYTGAGAAIVAMIALFVHYNVAIARGTPTIFDFKEGSAGKGAVGPRPGEPLIRYCQSCFCLYAWLPGPEVRAPDCPKCSNPTEPLPNENASAPKATAVLMPNTASDNVQIAVILLGFVAGLITLAISVWVGSGIGIALGIVLLVVAGGCLIYGNSRDVKKAKKFLATAAPVDLGRQASSSLRVDELKRDSGPTTTSAPTPTAATQPVKEDTISFACVCGKALRVKHSLAGKKCKCPACGQVTIVPVGVGRTNG